MNSIILSKYLPSHEGVKVNKKPRWMRVIEALTFIFALIAVLSPFAAILLPAILMNRQAATTESDLFISDAWVRPIEVTMSDHDMGDMSGVGGVTAAYMKIENRGNGADRLTSVSTDVASVVEIHRTEVNSDGIARMIPQPEGIELQPNSIVMIEPLGYHIMVGGLNRSLQIEDTITLLLNFESGKQLEIPVVVADFPPNME